MFKNKLILLILSGIASFLWLSPTGAYAQETPDALPHGDFSALREMDEAEVLQVISPTTLKLSNGQLINLTGIHLPDYTTEKAGPFALTALKVLKDMLEGQRVLIYQTKTKDLGRTNRMGHTLAHLVRKSDGAWVQGTLVRLGLAVVKTSQRNPEMAKQLYALEAQARADKIGLWEQSGIILTPEQAPEHLNSFQIVEGKIISTAMKKNRVYLNFGNRWQNDFTVSIAPENRRVFAKAMINPLDWRGKTIRVRGWVEDYNGAYIEIDHPEAVEILTQALVSPDTPPDSALP